MHLFFKKKKEEKTLFDLGMVSGKSKSDIAKVKESW